MEIQVFMDSPQAFYQLSISPTIIIHRSISFVILKNPTQVPQVDLILT